MLLCSGKTCSDIKSHSSQAVGASYVIDPDGEGGYEPFTVYCDMTDKNEVGVTVVSHDSESRTLVDGYEGKGIYERHVHYTAPGLTSVAQLAGLPVASAHCEQLSCTNAPIVLFSSMATNLAGGCHATPRT